MWIQGESFDKQEPALTDKQEPALTNTGSDTHTRYNVTTPHLEFVCSPC